MKLALYGKVVGHKLYYPDPKDHPDVELVKVELELGPTAKGATHCKAASKATLIVDPDETGKLQLGDQIALQVSDTQQRLGLQDGRAHRARGAEAAEPR